MSEFTTLRYYYIELGLVVHITGQILDLVHHEQRFLIQHTTKYHVLPVQMGSRRACDEELHTHATLTLQPDTRSYCVQNWPTLHESTPQPYHRQQTRGIEFHFKALVIEVVAVYAQTAGSIALQERSESLRILS